MPLFFTGHAKGSALKEAATNPGDFHEINMPLCTRRSGLCGPRSHADTGRMRIRRWEGAGTTAFQIQNG